MTLLQNSSIGITQNDYLKQTKIISFYHNSNMQSLFVFIQFQNNSIKVSIIISLQYLNITTLKM